MVFKWLLSQWKAGSALEVSLTPFLNWLYSNLVAEIMNNYLIKPKCAGPSGWIAKNRRAAELFPSTYVCVRTDRQSQVAVLLDMCLDDCLYISYSVMMLV